MTLHPPRIAAALVITALALSPALAGCGQAAEQVAEQAAEQAIGGGDVNIEDDSVTITDEEGNQMAAGENVSIPDSWPAEIPIYEGGSLTVVTVQADGVYAGWTSDQSPEDAVSAYTSALEDAGFTAGQETSVAGAIFREYTGNGYTVQVTGADADGQTSLVVVATKDA
jgi:hypothetical protein